VGVRTITIGRLTVEVFYPAPRGQNAGKTPRTYDIRLALPASQRSKIPDNKNPIQTCDCFADLPLDEAHGPYPTLIFVHGTASFRTQSLSHLTHLASRGFVVLAADHPGLKLADTLALVCPGEMADKRDLIGDVDAVLAALKTSAGGLSFLSGHTDLTRLGLLGHSAGGGTVAELADRMGVKAVVSWAAGAPLKKTAEPASALFVGGVDDKVVRFSAVQSGYQASAAPKRLVGIARAGHLVMTELCSLKNPDGENILTVAVNAGVCGANLAGFLFDCSDNYLPDDRGRPIVRYATTAVLESVLHCTNDDLSGLKARFPEVSTLEEQLKP
jgi:dienelactone hydrolase